MISAVVALERLRVGNCAFVSDVRGISTFVVPTRRSELVSMQEPFAIVLGCADSRVPVEIIFNQGSGDLFVIRAGNIVAPSQVGSIEFTIERFGTRLVVVLGHSMCSAVVATLEALERPKESRSSSLGSIVDRIRPALEALWETDLRKNREALLQQAVRANIRSSVDHLCHGSQILSQLIQHDGLRVVGAEYSLETGIVDFYEDPAEEKA